MARPGIALVALASLLSLAAPVLAQRSLEITSPADGTVVHPGQTVAVAVKTTKAYEMVGLLGAGFDTVMAPPFTSSIVIPKNIRAGLYTLTASGAPGNAESDSSAPITIDVEYVWKESSDASHLVQDAPGVEVETGGFPLMHRSAIPYAREARDQGIEGTVVVEITPDSSGHVESTRILSGPAELRKGVIKSLQPWHFGREAGSKPRQVTVRFNLSAAISAAPDAVASAQQPPAVPNTSYEFWVVARRQSAYRLKEIHTIALSDDARAELLKGLPGVGRQVSAADVLGMVTTTANFDSDLLVWLAVEGDDVSFTITPGFKLGDSEGDNEPGTAVVALPSTAGSARPGPIAEPARETPSPAAPRATPQRIRVSPQVQAAKLVTKVDAEYPPLAKGIHIQGVVRLTVVIDADGRVADVHVITGHPLLVDAALDAVKQWVYRPTIVNGRNVEVVTQVEVEFFQVD
jgi:TonB family protein